MSVKWAIRRLQEHLRNTAEPEVLSALNLLVEYADIIEHDVIADKDETR